MKLVEKMAKAIYERDALFGGHKPSWDELIPEGHLCADYRNKALAALKAIRESTPAMWDGSELDWNRFCADWKRAIDAAIAEAE